MSKLDFLSKYAVDGRHYVMDDEIDKALNDRDSSFRAAAQERLEEFNK